jgi:tetratricopeptide (TPR) repeat protein
MSYELEKNYPKARERFGRQLARSPEHLESLAHLGAVLLEEGQLDEARARLEQALARFPDHARARFDLGSVLEKQRAWEPAIAAFRRVIELQPEHAQAHYRLSLLYARTGQRDLAQKEMEEFRVLDEIDKQSQRELNRIRSQRGMTAAPVAAPPPEPMR